jgi:hypothetical protein
VVSALIQHEGGLIYIDPIADITYYGADKMVVAKRIKFLEWYECQKTELFDKNRLLERYCKN